MSLALSSRSETLQNAGASRAGAALLLVLGVTFLVFLPVVFNDFVTWDDVTFVVGNPRFNPPTLDTLRYYWTHAGANLYIPLTYTLWAALAKVSYVPTPDALGAHLNPYVFHLAGLLLHLVATAAVFGIVRLAVRRTWPAAFGALLFALHPIQVMAVAFVGATNTPLAAALALPAVWLYLRSSPSSGTPACGERSRTGEGWGGGSFEISDLKLKTNPHPAFVDDARRWRTPGYLLACALFAAAMLAKPTAVVAPALAFLLDLAVNRRGLRSSIVAILPWIVLVIPCLVWTRLIQAGPPAAVHEPLWSRPLVAGDAVAFYVGKLFVPHPLTIDYGRTPARVLSSPAVWITWLVPAAMFAGAIALRRRAPIVAVGLVIFPIAMLPNSGLVPFDFQLFSTTADHYVYLSMVGVALVAASLVANARRVSIAGVIVVAALVACVVLTERQIATWRDGERLFRHAIAVNPASWMSQNNLATIVMDRAPDEAIALCEAALRAKPDYALAFNNLGSALMLKGDHAAALGAFEQAHHFAPDSTLLAANYARALSMNGRPDEAAAIYRGILAIDSENGRAREALAHLPPSSSGPTTRAP